MNELTHLDLFSGIGGFSIAFERAGFKTIGFSEIDHYASKILVKNWPNVPNFGDIRSVRGIPATVVTGGFPCQPFSFAGKRRGKEDNRHLWPEMLRVIAEARPAWVVGENVAGIINLELDRVLSDLENIGYAVWPLVIPACAVDARHRRDRVWIVAHSTSGFLSAEQECQREMLGRSKVAVGDGQDGPLAIAHATGVSKFKGHERNRSSAVQFSGESLQGHTPARWLPESGLGRVANGIPNRSHRLKVLGNAIVPQVAEIIAHAIKSVIQS